MQNHTGPREYFTPSLLWETLPRLPFALLVDAVMIVDIMVVAVMVPDNMPTTRRFIQVTKIEVRKALFEYHSRASEGS